MTYSQNIHAAKMRLSSTDRRLRAIDRQHISPVHKAAAMREFWRTVEEDYRIVRSSLSRRRALAIVFPENGDQLTLQSFFESEEAKRIFEDKKNVLGHFLRPDS